MMGRLRSIQGISGVNSENTTRRARRDEFYKRMKQQEKEAQNELGNTLPPLLTYILKKATHTNVQKEGTALVYTEEDVVTRREDSHKDEKENFFLDVMFTDSQIHIASIETGSSLLLYLYKGSMIVQKKPVQQRDYSILNASLNKVDLFLGDRRAHSAPWISSKDIHTLNNLERNFGLQSFPFSFLPASFQADHSRFLSISDHTESEWLHSFSCLFSWIPKGGFSESNHSKYRIVQHPNDWRGVLSFFECDSLHFTCQSYHQYCL